MFTTRDSAHVHGACRQVGCQQGDLVRRDQRQQRCVLRRSVRLVTPSPLSAPYHPARRRTHTHPLVFVSQCTLRSHTSFSLAILSCTLVQGTESHCHHTPSTLAHHAALRRHYRGVGCQASRSSVHAHCRRAHACVAHLCSPLLGHCCDTARSAEVQSYTFDLCNSLDDCSQYVTSMCNEVLTKLEGDAGTFS